MASRPSPDCFRGSTEALRYGPSSLYGHNTPYAIDDGDMAPWMFETDLIRKLAVSQIEMHQPRPFRHHGFTFGCVGQNRFQRGYTSGELSFFAKQFNSNFDLGESAGTSFEVTASGR